MTTFDTQNRLADLMDELRRRGLSVPPATIPSGGYDYASAQRAGLASDETGHWPSRVPSGTDEGLILKSREHETFRKTIEGERSAGYSLFQDRRSGRIYSFPPGTEDQSRFDPWQASGDRMTQIVQELQNRNTIESRRGLLALESAGIAIGEQPTAPPPYFETQEQSRQVREAVPQPELRVEDQPGFARATTFPNDVEQQAFNFVEASKRGEIDLMQLAGQQGFRVSDQEWQDYQASESDRLHPIEYQAARFLASQMEEAGAQLQPFDLGDEQYTAQQAATYLDQVRAGQAEFDYDQVNQAMEDVIRANQAFEADVSAGTIQQLPEPVRVARTFLNRVTELVGEGIPNAVVQLIAAGGGLIEDSMLDAAEKTGMLSPDQASQLRERSDEIRDAYVRAVGRFQPGRLISGQRIEELQYTGDYGALLGRERSAGEQPGGFQSQAYLERVQREGTTGERIAHASAVLGAEILTSIPTGGNLGARAAAEFKGVGDKVAKITAGGAESALEKLGLFGGRETGAIGRALTRERTLAEVADRLIPRGLSRAERTAARAGNRKLADAASKFAQALNLNLHEGVGKFLGSEGTLALMRVGSAAAQGVPRDQLYDVWAQTIADDPLLIRKVAINLKAISGGRGDSLPDSEKIQPEDWLDLVITPTFAAVSLGLPQATLKGIDQALEKGKNLSRAKIERYRDWLAMRELVRATPQLADWLDLNSNEAQTRILRMSDRAGVSVDEIFPGLRTLTEQREGVAGELPPGGQVAAPREIPPGGEVRAQPSKSPESALQAAERLDRERQQRKAEKAVPKAAQDFNTAQTALGDMGTHGVYTAEEIGKYVGTMEPTDQGTVQSMIGEGPFVVAEVPVDQINENVVMQGGDVDQEKLDTAKMFIEAGSPVPPVVAAVSGNELLIADGTHRLLAAREAGQKTIMAVVPQDYAQAHNLANSGGESRAPIAPVPRAGERPGERRRPGRGKIPPEGERRRRPEDYRPPWEMSREEFGGLYDLATRTVDGEQIRVVQGPAGIWTEVNAETSEAALDEAFQKFKELHRQTGVKPGTPMAGVPYHRLESSLRRMIEKPTEEPTTPEIPNAEPTAPTGESRPSEERQAPPTATKKPAKKRPGKPASEDGPRVELGPVEDSRVGAGAIVVDGDRLDLPGLRVVFVTEARGELGKPAKLGEGIDVTEANLDDPGTASIFLEWATQPRYKIDPYIGVKWDEALDVEIGGNWRVAQYAHEARTAVLGPLISKAAEVVNAHRRRNLVEYDPSKTVSAQSFPGQKIRLWLQPDSEGKTSIKIGKWHRGLPSELAPKIVEQWTKEAGRKRPQARTRFGPRKTPAPPRLPSAIKTHGAAIEDLRSSRLVAKDIADQIPDQSFTMIDSEGRRIAISDQQKGVVVAWAKPHYGADGFVHPTRKISSADRITERKQIQDDQSLPRFAAAVFDNAFQVLATNAPRNNEFVGLSIHAGPGDYTGEITLASLWHAVKSASLMTSDVQRAAMLVRNINGTLGIVARSPEIGVAEINVDDGNKPVMGVNVNNLSDLLGTMARLDVRPDDRLYVGTDKSGKMLIIHRKPYGDERPAITASIMGADMSAYVEKPESTDPNDPADDTTEITNARDPREFDSEEETAAAPDPREGAEDRSDGVLPRDKPGLAKMNQAIADNLAGLIRGKRAIQQSLILGVDADTGKALTEAQRSKMAETMAEIEAEQTDMLSRYETLFDVEAAERLVHRAMQAAAPDETVDLASTPPPGGASPNPPGAASPSAHSWIRDEAETPAGRRLVRKMKADQAGAQVGVRSIFRLLQQALNVELRVGPEQTTRRHPAHYASRYHMIRAKAASGVNLLHEVGHALSAVLRDSNSDLFQNIKEDLLNLTGHRDGPGVYASKESAEEGFAEFVRLYVQRPEAIPANVRESVMQAVDNTWPEMGAAVRDTARGWYWHNQRSRVAQFRSYQTDAVPKAPLGERVRDGWAGVLAYAVSSGAALDMVKRRAFRALTESSIDVARKWEAEISDSPADFDLAYQSNLKVPIEVSHALGGESKGPNGLRIRMTDDRALNILRETIQQAESLERTAPDKLTKFDRALLAANFEIPEKADAPAFGEWLYLTDYSIRDVYHAVGAEKWGDFETYGWARALLSRAETKGLVYPGATDGLKVGDLRAIVAEAESANPDWDAQFKRIQRFMDQSLLISLISGEIDEGGIVRIQSAFPDYWPLPRQIERGLRGRMSGAGAYPSAGIRRARGSERPVASVLDAIESRIKKALESYYQNRMMLAVAKAQETLRKADAPLLEKAPALRFMTRMRLEPKKVATLQPAEMAQVIADYVNTERLKTLLAEPAIQANGKLAGVIKGYIKRIGAKGGGKNTLATLAEAIEQLTNGAVVWEPVMPDSISIDFPGRAMWRASKPRGINIVAPFENGTRTFYQVEDKILFDFFSRAEKPGRFISWIGQALMPITRPWKRLLTQNLVFATWNVLGRDITNAMILGESPRSIIPGYYAAIGLLNRITRSTPDAIQQAELLSKALDTVTRERHRNVVESFKAILAEDVLLPGWRNMSVMERTLALPGQATSAVLKPVEMMLWATGQRFISQQSESLPREGAYIEARRRGHSSELAQSWYDRSTGNFGAHPGSSSLHQIFRMAGFLNPGVQIMYGMMQRMTVPDPKARAYNWLVRLPSIALYAAAAAAVNYLATPEEDRDRMRERPDNDRMGYKALFGRFRMPFDYGLTGAIESFAWNAVESYLLDDPVSGKAKAHALLQRATDLPGHPIAFMHPWLRTWIESEANYQFYFGQEIVPPWLETAFPYNPELQAFDTTPEAYRLVGKWANMSPLRVQHIVRSALTSQVDESVEAFDMLLGKRQTYEPADVPFLGRIFVREPRGWRSASVQSITDAEQQYQELAKAFAAVAMDPETPRETVDRLRSEIDKIRKLHDAYIQIRYLWKEAKSERAKPEPDKSRVRRLELQMTRAAQDALQSTDRSP